jgi:hypothetical protein
MKGGDADSGPNDFELVAQDRHASGVYTAELDGVSGLALRRRLTQASRKLGLDLKWWVMRRGSSTVSFELVWGPCHAFGDLSGSSATPGGRA